MSDVLQQIDIPRAEPVVFPVQRWRLGDLELCEASQRAQWKGSLLPLTLGEFRVLKLLITAGRDCSHREIYDALRGIPGMVSGRGEDGFKSNVRTIIRRIRRKFEGVDPGFDRIRVYSGFGYRWQTPAGRGA